MKKYQYHYLLLVLSLVNCQYSSDHNTELGALEPKSDTATIELQNPKGQYSVGTIIISFTDKNRREVASQDTTEWRTLYSQIWYPTDEKGTTSHYLGDTTRLLGFAQLEESTWISRFDKTQTNSIANAEVSNQQTKYPVVFFSGGFGLSKNYFTSFIESLASYGYIIVGVDLPYVNPLVTEAGKAINPRGSFWDSFPLTKGIDNYEEGEEKLAFTNKYYSSDYLFIYDQLKDLNADPLFHFSMDLDNVASLGHSAGASPTFALLELEESPFSVYIIYDVTLHAHFASENISYPITIRTNSPIQLFILEYAWIPSQEFISSLNTELSIAILENTNHSSLADIDFIRHASSGNEEDMKLALNNINKIINHTVNFLDLHMKTVKTY